MLLMIDNFDSFTFNLVHYFTELGETVKVARNDAITIEEIRELQPDYLVLSPGPCTPDESGICQSIVAELQGEYPILGVCLGHQVIAQEFGANIVKTSVVHGKTSAIYHQSKGLFQDLPQPVTMTRYHSLVIDPDTMPEEVKITAFSQDQRGDFEHIMAIQHQSLPLYGVQFHPESILSDHGHQLLKNFLEMNRK